MPVRLCRRLAAEYVSAINTVKLITQANDSRILPVKWVPTGYGIRITFPSMLTVDTLAPGEFYTIEVDLDSSMWDDTSRFPCMPSLYETAMPVCDYYLHGWQTYEGSPETVKVGRQDAL